MRHLFIKPTCICSSTCHAYMSRLLTAERTCPPDTFTCESNKQVGTYPCLDRRRVCDGIRNCHGGEDEAQTCPPRSCRPTQFQCANGLCVSQRFKCDHDNDCGDNSDEPDDCGKQRFRCPLRRLLFRHGVHKKTYNINKLFRTLTCSTFF